ncbi:MAG: DUF945 domain-containing protein [Ruminiclostridium sp.]|nr:DUF945 domain-containing protein [Ruminiclostridium sp.]
MPANVESMFYVRETPWHGLGVRVENAVCSGEALKLSGLDWNVIQKPIQTTDSLPLPGFRANIRETDNRVLGVVTDRYKIVQNKEAFEFTDALLGEGVQYETAGSLQQGKRVWMLARLPQEYIIAGDEVCPYLVFSNSHDGSGSIKVCMTPIRVVCQNTLNLAIHDAKRIWTIVHTGDINEKLNEARKTLLLAEMYMDKLSEYSNVLQKKRIPDARVMDYISELIPLPEDASKTQERNVQLLRNDLITRYFEAPDLKYLPKTGWRFINAVSDFATHMDPLRKTDTYKNNLFMKTIDGNPLIDKAHEIILAVA